MINEVQVRSNNNKPLFRTFFKAKPIKIILILTNQQSKKSMGIEYLWNFEPITLFAEIMSLALV